MVVTVRIAPELADDATRAAERARAVVALRQTADLLETPHTWTQGCQARDFYGQPVTPTSSSAVRWCLSGGLALCAGLEGWTFYVGYQALRSVLPSGDDPARFNDRATTAGQVVALARQAAKRLEQQNEQEERRR